jgi:hypothetical protein
MFYVKVLTLPSPLAGGFELLGVLNMCRCGSNNTEIKIGPFGPHYAKLICSNCKRYIQWLPKPKLNSKSREDFTKGCRSSDNIEEELNRILNDEVE